MPCGVVFTTNKNLPPTLFLDQGFASNALSLANASNVELVSYDRKGVTPTDYQWNFNIQRQLPGSILAGGRLLRQQAGPHVAANRRQPRAARAGQHQREPPVSQHRGAGHRRHHHARQLVRIQKDGWSDYNACKPRSKSASRRAYFHRVLRIFENNRAGRHVRRSESAGLDGGQIRFQPGHDATFCGQRDLCSCPLDKARQFGAHWNRVTDAFLGGWSFAPILTVITGMPLNITRERQSRPIRAAVWTGPMWSATGSSPIPRSREWFNTAAFVANRALHLRQRGSQHDSRTRAGESGSGPPQIVPDYGAGQRAASHWNRSTRPIRRPWALPTPCWEMRFSARLPLRPPGPPRGTTSSD